MEHKLPEKHDCRGLSANKNQWFDSSKSETGTELESETLTGSDFDHESTKNRAGSTTYRPQDNLSDAANETSRDSIWNGYEIWIMMTLLLLTFLTAVGFVL